MLLFFISVIVFIRFGGIYLCFGIDLGPDFYISLQSVKNDKIWSLCREEDDDFKVVGAY